MNKKQMEEKKKEFIIKLAEYRTLYDNSFHSDTEEEILYLIETAGDVLWDFVKKLVEEVEREKSEEIEELKHWLKRYEKDISNAIN